MHEPAQQLVQHYGQKLFAQLWTAKRVRFVFEQSEDLPDYASDIPPEEDVDQWSLNTLRFIQYQELESSASYDPESVPAFTRDGFERVQNLRLTVAEAQFASQFNGSRSVQQIAKNLRLDLKFARLTLFRFQVARDRRALARRHSGKTGKARFARTIRIWRLSVLRLSWAMEPQAETASSDVAPKIVALPDAVPPPPTEPFRRAGKLHQSRAELARV